jgi:hypothetical protein
MYTQRQFLACATLDGRVLAWRVNSAGPDGAEFIKISDMEIRDAFKGFDSSAGIAELRYHPSQETLTVSTRDGGIFIFDVTPLVTQNKPYVVRVSFFHIHSRYLNSLTDGMTHFGMKPEFCGGAASQ